MASSLIDKNDIFIQARSYKPNITWPRSDSKKNQFDKPFPLSLNLTESPMVVLSRLISQSIVIKFRYRWLL